VEAATVVLCGSIAVFLALFPEWSITTVFGAKYVPGSHLVPIFALAMFFFSLLPVCVQFLLATDKRRFIYILVSGVVVETLGILLFHGSTTVVAWIMALVAIGMVVLMGAYMLSDWNAYRERLPQDVAGASMKAV
jgi:O-antigen/teichoic acid export membrane protein